MRMRKYDIQPIIEKIYDAVLEKNEWPALLQFVTDSLDGNSAMLRQINPHTRSVSFHENVGYDPTFARAYRDYFCQLDPYQNSFKTAAVGELIDTEEIVSTKSRRLTEYFNEFELPQDKLFAIGGVVYRNAHDEIQFGIQRGKSMGSFSTQDKDFLRVLLPHVARAIRLNSALESVHYHNHLAQDALDQIGAGIFLHDAADKPVYCNRCAEELLKAKVVRIGVSGLTLSEEMHSAKLRDLMRQAKHGVPGNMLLECRGIAEKFSIWVVALKRPNRTPGLLVGQIATAVFVCRTGALLRWQPLQQHYGLTQAEAKLAAALADGKTLEEIASTQKVSYETARSQLKAVFSKTGTRRQSELIVLLLKSMMAGANNSAWIAGPTH